MTARIALLISTGICLGLLCACVPGGRAEKPEAAVPVSDSVLSLLNELAAYHAPPAETKEDEIQARQDVVHRAKDAVLDARNSFAERVTLACWLQQMREELSDVAIAELSSASHGEVDADPRIVYSLGMFVWEAALQASEDPFRWREEGKPIKLARQGLDILLRATNTEPGNGLYSLTTIYADYLMTGRLQGTLISWRWDEDVQAECAARIEPLLARFTEATKLQGMSGPPYFTPLHSWRDYASMEIGGGLYNGEYASTIMPACLVLVLRDLGRRQETGKMAQTLVAVEKLLGFEPKSHDRLSAVGVALRALAQALEEMMPHPALRGEAAALAQKARGFYKAMSDDWLSNYADDYARVALSDRRAALQMEKRFVGKYSGEARDLAEAMREFVAKLKPEDVNPDAPPAPW